MRYLKSDEAPLAPPRKVKIMETKMNKNTTITAVAEPKAKRARVLKNPQYRCSYCGLFGHNVRTCPKKAADLLDAEKGASGATV